MSNKYSIFNEPYKPQFAVKPYISDGMFLHLSDLPLHTALLYQSGNVPISSAPAQSACPYQ
jgi:hypothetical protein